MFARWSIKYKLGFGVGLLVLIVVVLLASGVIGVTSYRRLVRTVSHRAAELPVAEKVTRSATEMRDTVARSERTVHDIGSDASHDPGQFGVDFQLHFTNVKDALEEYRELLEETESTAAGIDDKSDELATCHQIELLLADIAPFTAPEEWAFGTPAVRDEVGEVYDLASALPEHLRSRMRALKENVRGAYHTLIALTWTTGILAIAMLVLSMRLFYVWVFEPLGILIHGSRQVAADDFDHRIQLDSHDEMGELADAMNDMTQRFCEIRADLDRQVQERTREVVRSEQLASVGFLAAGVAHEINNPLASIAMCAESLESRLRHIIDEDDAKPDDQHNPEVTVLKSYLRRIQDEAFRCSGITEKLLDFSRIGDAERLDVDLNEVAQDVIDMVKTVGRYKNKHIEFTRRGPIMTHVNSQEIKQVVLNLITNALDSLADDGTVTVSVSGDSNAQIVVEDDGCGMTQDVLEHLFEPFFTRRRDGQGTGLGLSISYRIVSDHGGKIEAASDGPGHGSRFQLTLPLANSSKERTHDRSNEAA